MVHTKAQGCRWSRAALRVALTQSKACMGAGMTASYTVSMHVTSVRKNHVSILYNVALLNQWKNHLSHFFFFWWYLIPSFVIDFILHVKQVNGTCLSILLVRCVLGSYQAEYFLCFLFCLWKHICQFFCPARLLVSLSLTPTLHSSSFLLFDWARFSTWCPLVGVWLHS